MLNSYVDTRIEKCTSSAWPQWEKDGLRNCQGCMTGVGEESFASNSNVGERNEGSHTCSAVNAFLKHVRKPWGQWIPWKVFVSEWKCILFFSSTPYLIDCLNRPKRFICPREVERNKSKYDVITDFPTPLMNMSSTLAYVSLIRTENTPVHVLVQPVPSHFLCGNSPHKWVTQMRTSLSLRVTWSTCE